MKRSAYITWAKSRERFRYNIGRSSIRSCPPELLPLDGQTVPINGANAYGWPPLVEAIASRYGVATDQVSLAIGTSMANHLVCAALLEPGDHVLVETPGYEPLTALPRYLGAEVTALPRRRSEGYALDVDAVAARLTTRTRLVVLTDFHNPSGRSCGDSGLESLARLAANRDIHVLVDEVYREFTFTPGEQLAVHRSDRFVSTCSLTKAYGLDGLRAGWILASPAITARIHALNDLFGIIMPHPSEWLAGRALAQIDALRASVDALLRTNRPRVESFVAARPELDWLPPDAGPVAFVRLAGHRVDRLVDLLEAEHDSTLTPGRFFGDPVAFRVGFGMPTVDLDAGLARLGTALDQLANNPDPGGTHA